MTVRVRIGDIAQPQHLTVFPYRDDNRNNIVRMEVYTGRIRANFYAGGGPVHREQFVSFLPVNAQAEVHSYQQDSNIIDKTILVTPSSFQDDDDETNVVAIDDFDLELVEKNVPGKQIHCFELRSRVAAHHANLIAITYHITVLTNIGRQRPKVEPLDVDQTP